MKGSDVQETSEAEYWRVNAAVNEVYFDGRFEDRPVYLDPDGSLKAPLAKSLGVQEDEIDSCIGRAVAGTLSVGNKNVYAWHSANTRIWDQEDFPPFIALLLSFSIAAKNMREGDEISQNNFYGRLSEVFSGVVSKDDVSNARESSREFWILLNRWLQETDFAFGRPTAQQVTSWTYVSYALSQALVREVDRDSFKKLFSKYGLSAEDGLAEAELEPYLVEWMSGSGPSGFLKRIWSQDNLRERVISAASQELETWDGLISDQGKDAQASRRLFLVLRIKKMPRQRISMYLCAGNGNGEEPALTVSSMIIAGEEATVKGQQGEGSFAFVNLLGAEACYLAPTESIDRGKALVGEVALVDSAGTQFLRLPRPIVPMVRNGAGHYFREVSQIVKHERYVVLCHDNWRQRVDAYFNSYARDDYQYIAGAKIGLPAGWGFFDKVELVSRPTVEIENDLQDLVPTERGATIYFAGGLPLARDVWLANCLPSVFATESGGALVLQLLEPELKKDKLILEEKDSVENPNFLSSSELCLENKYCKLVALAGKTKRIEKNISFRSANNPKIHAKDEQRFLCFELDGARTFDSASALSLESDKATLLSGMNWLYGAPKSHAVIALSLDEVTKFPFVKSDYIEYELVEVDDVYDDEESNASTKTCISRGCHAWNVPFGVGKKSQQAILTCSDCGARVIWKAKSTVQNKRKSPFSAGVTRKVLVNISEIAPTADQVYDALCYTGSGSWLTLQKYMSYLVDEPWKCFEKAKELFDLGLIDMELDQLSKRPKAWSIPSPTVVITGAGFAYISGFRCASLIDEIKETFELVGAVSRHVEEIGVPENLSWNLEGVELEILKEILASLKDPLGRVVAVVENPALSIVNRLPSLANMLIQFGEATPPLREISQYLPSTNSWEEARFNGRPGLYRFNGVPRRYFFTNSRGATSAITYDLGKIASAKLAEVRLHDYENQSGTFISVLGCEPPGLFRRALVACSGKLPVFGENNTLRYSSVPQDLAIATLAKLYREEN